MLSRCIRTVSNGKADMPLARFLTSAIRPRSVRLLHMQPWLARSSALVSASLQFEEDRPPSLDDIKWKQLALARSEVFTQTSLEQELRYLRDPRKLADYTLNLLQKDQEQKAYELVKMSSKSLPCTVSWNHLINFEMSQGRVANACKIYNDVREHRSERRPIANIPQDEEASSTAGCPDLYSPFPWTCHVPSIPTVPRSCPLDIPVDVCR